MALEMWIALAMLMLFLLYRALCRRRNAPRCPHLRQVRRSPGSVQVQCGVSANPITDPRMTTAFQPNVCASAQYKTCPTFRAAKAGRTGP